MSWSREEDWSREYSKVSTVDDLSKYIDVSVLTNEQIDNLSTLKDKIDNVKSQLVSVEAWLTVVWNREWKLSEWMDTQLTLQELSSPDADRIRENIIRLKSELRTLEQDKITLVRTLINYVHNRLDWEEIKQMQEISNMDFLKLPINERLRFITVWNIDFNDIQNANISSLEFTFTFDWKFNEQLYHKTTAWQVLPKNVRDIHVDWNEYSRRWLNWEFFSQTWERLKIHEWTKIDISRFASNEEMQILEKQLVDWLEWYWEWDEYILATKAFEKWYDPKVIIELFWKEFSQLSDISDKTSFLEDKLTQIARYEDDFYKEYWNTNPIIVDWKFSVEFAWFITWFFDRSKYEAISKNLGYDLTQLRAFSPNVLSAGPANMENIDIDWLTKEQIDLILTKDKFVPYSKEAIVLFTAAAQSVWLPAEWGKMESLHYILWRESNWEVWRLNYTIKGFSEERFKEVASSTNARNPIWSSSTASWLGQLLLTNVDKYYPDWRSWIGDALNEAVWMMRYIKDRYGDPDIARSVYWVIWKYTHPEKWVLPKNFREWY